jgi:hypothetical protein
MQGREHRVLALPGFCSLADGCETSYFETAWSASVLTISELKNWVNDLKAELCMPIKSPLSSIDGFETSFDFFSYLCLELVSGWIGNYVKRIVRS